MPFCLSSSRSENCRVLQEAKPPVNAFMDMMNQMGISFGGEASTPHAAASKPVTLADVGFYWQGDAPTSENALKVQEVLNGATGTVDNDAVICFKIGNNQPFYADFSHGKGTSSTL